MTQKVNKYNKIILKNEDILTFYFLKEPKKKNIGWNIVIILKI